jgi:hypothetical protein
VAAFFGEGHRGLSVIRLGVKIGSIVEQQNTLLAGLGYTLPSR